MRCGSYKVPTSHSMHISIWPSRRFFRERTSSHLHIYMNPKPLNLAYTTFVLKNLYLNKLDLVDHVRPRTWHRTANFYNFLWPLNVNPVVLGAETIGDFLLFFFIFSSGFNYQYFKKTWKDGRSGGKIKHTRSMILFNHLAQEGLFYFKLSFSSIYVQVNMYNDNMKTIDLNWKYLQRHAVTMRHVIPSLNLVDSCIILCVVVSASQAARLCLTDVKNSCQC